jgi:Leucine-rich repeat (LRR) protein
LQKLGADLQAIWPSLLKIDLSENQLNEVPPCLLNSQMAGSVSHIASIDISGNKIEELPLGLTKLRHLRQFRCNKNQLRQVTG